MPAARPVQHQCHFTASGVYPQIVFPPKTTHFNPKNKTLDLADYVDSPATRCIRVRVPVHDSLTGRNGDGASLLVVGALFPIVVRVLANAASSPDC
jgi:hypothetical protein